MGLLGVAVEVEREIVQVLVSKDQVTEYLKECTGWKT